MCWHLCVKLHSMIDRIMKNRARNKSSEVRLPYISHSYWLRPDDDDGDVTVSNRWKEMLLFKWSSQPGIQTSSSWQADFSSGSVTRQGKVSLLTHTPRWRLIFKHKEPVSFRCIIYSSSKDQSRGFSFHWYMRVFLDLVYTKEFNLGTIKYIFHRFTQAFLE